MRQFVSSEAPDVRGLLCVEGKDFRYLRKVLRVKGGDMIEVRLPSGLLAPMTVCRTDDASGMITLQVCAVSGNTGSATVTRGVTAHEIDTGAAAVTYMLFQFIARPQKMELIIRQAVECGIAVVVPVAGEYSQKGSVDAIKGKAVKSERLQRIIREAREQSGSPVETYVHDVVSPEEASELWKHECRELSEAETAAITLSERTDKCKPLPAVLAERTAVKKAAIAVGSEGGISPREIEILQSGGFTPVHFACNILRCETAALYGIAALQSAVSWMEK
jgi:16S rRNA (uracil1498-N3)-methyltransferase